MQWLVTFIPTVLLFIVVSGCRTWNNFTAYFNTYYNMNRLMIEVEDEFGYLRDQEVSRPIPPLLYVERTTLSPDLLQPESERKRYAVPDFMLSEIIPQHFLAATAAKLDSIILKGSKILAKHPQSDYIAGTLYLMAKAYFYQSEWADATIKCLEFIELFPRSEYSPDVHLLLAKLYLIQRKFEKARQFLDRTIDIAWPQERYDILSETFRLQASLALYESKIEDGLRPYRRAIAQADDPEHQAQWQFELAALLYRLGYFQHAIREFEHVFQYDPNDVTAFAAQLYRATALGFAGQFETARSIISELYDEDIDTEWEEYIIAQQLQLARLQSIEEDSLQLLEQQVDARYPRSLPLSIYFYDRAMDLFEKGQLLKARQYFGRAALQKSPLFLYASAYFSLLNNWQKKLRFANPLRSKAQSATAPDSLKATVARTIFELGRIHHKLGIIDSARFYYNLAAHIAPPAHEQRAKALYALALLLKQNHSTQADSIFTIIATQFPRTAYGNAARLQLGYTPEAIIDSARELYESAYHLLRANEYDFAVQQLRQLLRNFPHSSYAPAALYLLGWFYERYQYQYDSAFQYYYQLIQRFPETPYARHIYPAVSAYIAHHYADNDSSKPQLPKLSSTPTSSPPPGSSPSIPGMQPPPPVPGAPLPSPIQQPVVPRKRP